MKKTGLLFIIILLISVSYAIGGDSIDTSALIDHFLYTDTGALSNTIANISYGSYDTEGCSYTTESIIEPTAGYGGDGIQYGGYYFANSVAESDSLFYQPEFIWIDAWAGVNTPQFSNSDGDDGYANVQLGFTFQFFGNDYASIYLGTNGYCQFTNPISNYNNAVNLTIPELNAPSNLISMCATDLTTLGDNTTCWYGTNSDGCFVYSVLGWSDFDEEESIDVQLILNQNGRIKIQYRNYQNPDNETGLNSILGDMCVGIENLNGTVGHQYRNNGAGGRLSMRWLCAMPFLQMNFQNLVYRC